MKDFLCFPLCWYARERPPTPEPVTLLPPPTATDEAEVETSIPAIQQSPQLELETSLRTTGWNILKDVLKTTHEISDIFPPLKTALTGLLKIMEVVDVCARPVLPFLYKLS